MDDIILKWLPLKTLGGLVGLENSQNEQSVCFLKGKEEESV